MRILTLWHPGDDGDMPWLIDAVDEYTIDNNGDIPPTYLEKKKQWPDCRELWIDIPDKVVRAAFAIPVFRTKVNDGE